MNTKKFVTILTLAVVLTSLGLFQAKPELVMAQDELLAPAGGLSAGRYHTCARRADGSIDCWGYNSYGQATDQPGPYNEVSAGGDHTCARRPDGSIDCWGNNNYGQAADQPGPYTQVSAGQYHTCALTPSGAVDCWGANYSGQAVDQLGPYTQVSASGDHTCALTPSGAVDCWGNNNYGQATDQPGPYTQVSTGQIHTCALTPSGVVDCWGDNSYSQAADQPGPYNQVDAGSYHTCALTPSGAADCWGNNGNSQATDQPGPYTWVNAGDYHTCALTPTGAVDCWGYNNYGQATDQPGPYEPYDSLPPETILDSTPGDPSYGGVTFTFSSNESEATFECALDGSLFAACASPQVYIVLAVGEHTFQVRAIDLNGNVDASPASFAWTVATVPPVPAPDGIASAGGAHTCALRPSGAVDCWGENSSGQAEDQPGPYTQVSTGQIHTCALTPDGAVDCWGDNGSGQATDQSGPYTQVSAGQYHTCALAPSGAVDCWGDNSSGQAEDQPGPYVQVGVGLQHTCALTPSGAVDCWGHNGSGRATDQPGPYTQVSAGFWHTCALTPAGTADCWGFNGNGEATDQTGPYAQVSTGRYHTCALTASGGVDCWGYNGSGRATDQPGPYGSYDSLPPETILLSTPADPSYASVTFTFSSNEGEATFECALDGGLFAACASPQVYIVPAVGEHTFQVRAIDLGGNIDASPASFTWTVASVPPVPAPDGIANAGGIHTCALLPSGVVDCWGAGETNTGTDPHFGQATDHPGPYNQVSAGQYHTCALTRTSAVDCWGRNNYGQAVSQPGPYTQVSAGQYHTCALTPSGAVDCWGANYSGQAVDQPGPYTQVSASGDHTCALTPSGAVDCWGNNDFSQAADQPGPYTQVSAGGYHTCALTPSGAVDCWGYNYYSQAADQLGPYTQVSAGFLHTCVLTPTGTVDCWGNNNYGQATDQPGPYTQVSPGLSHTCALTPSGVVDCWGLNNYSQATDQPGPYGPYDTLPPETTIDSTPADPSYGGATFTFSSNESEATFECALDGGLFAACASPQVYIVLAVGEHTFQVRAIDLNGNVDASPTFIAWTVASVPPVPAPDGIASAGGFHTCALTPDGVVDCWGYDIDGQAVDQPGPYTQVSAGYYHTCALTPDGAVDCWGNNGDGQAADQTGPYTRVSAGDYHTCALTPSGAVDCWGYNNDGQAEDQPDPYTQVSAGRIHTCALTPSGAVDCWGYNGSGQATGQPGPYTQVSAGGFHTCALTPSGAVDCWGYNSDGRATDQPGPYAQVSAGGYHTCALTPTGEVDCWGNNTYGQSAGQPGLYTQVSAGFLHTCALTPSGAVDCWGNNNDGQGTGQPGPYMFPENDPPVLANISLSGLEDSPMAFSTSTFRSAFSDANPCDVLVRVKIVSLPAHGALTLNGAAVTVGQEILASDLDGWVFTPAADWYGTVSFAWNASDRQDYAATDAIATLTITPLPDVQSGPVFTVNSTGADTDHACTDMHCTLRDAIEAANNDSTASTIELAAGAIYTLQELDNAENGIPQITSPITINAHGATLQRSSATGTPDFRAFYVSSSGTLALNRITISGFKSQTSGGALFNEGSLTIIGCTLAGNIATKDGGTISNMGTLTIANSTFSNNGAGSKGSAVFNARTLTVLSSTIAGNNSGPASGAIHTTDTTVLKNTVLVRGASGANCYGTLASGSVANMADDSSCGSSATVKTTAEIALGALASNGGPTQTMALASGSTAIDLGNTTACTNSLMAYGSGWTDQRGYNRFADGPDADTVAQCDIGAFEYGSSELNPNPGVDTEPPLVFIDQTPATPDGNNNWYRGPVSLLPWAIDDSEVIDLRCTLDPAAPPASFDDLPEDLCSFLSGAAVESDGLHTLYAAAMDIYGNQSEVASASFQIDATPLALTCPAAGPFLLHSGDQAIGPAGVDAGVSGLDEAASTLSGIVTTEAIGMQTLTFTATDLASNSASLECSYEVIYDFGGFYPPVEPAPTFNTAEPGSAIPLKFSLAGDQGLDILAEGFPTVQQVAPNTLDPIGEPSAMEPAGNSRLSYDPETGWYIYIWKTDKSWAGTAWKLTIQLIDGTEHVAYFLFQ